MRKWVSRLSSNLASMFAIVFVFSLVFVFVFGVHVCDCICIVISNSIGIFIFIINMHIHYILIYNAITLILKISQDKGTSSTIFDGIWEKFPNNRIRLLRVLGAYLNI